MALLIVWVLGLSPVVVWAITTLLVGFGLPAPLREALVLMGASSPLVTSVAIALIVGLDATLAMIAVLVATALVPFTLPLVAQALLGVSLDIGLASFMLRLALLVGAAFAMAWLAKRLVAPSTLSSQAGLLDGVTVVSLVVFATAIMDGVAAYAFEAPRYVALALAGAFGFNLLLQALGCLAFIRLRARGALTAALLSGNRNLGLVLVALDGQASVEVTMFFALAQIPMYTLPALLLPVYRRVLGPRPAPRVNSR